MGKGTSLVYRWLGNIPLTRLKLKAAGVLYRITRIFYENPQREIMRKGIRYEIDLREGIELSLFLFGNFQKHVSQNKFVQLPEDGTVIDVGANSGIMTLQFAQSVTKGQVHAFEPTHYAWKKLQRNLTLNPELNQRITANQCFVSDQPADNPSLPAFSSWRIDKANAADDTHPVHGGSKHDTAGVPALTLDQYAEKQGLKKVALIKIDTDGHELAVLRGAAQLIESQRPAIIFELGMYIMDERGISFSDYVNFFDHLGYDCYTSTRKTPITISNVTENVPQQGTIDVLALPKEN